MRGRSLGRGQKDETSTFFVLPSCTHKQPERRRSALHSSHSVLSGRAESLTGLVFSLWFLQCPPPLSAPAPNSHFIIPSFTLSNTRGPPPGRHSFTLTHLPGLYFTHPGPLRVKSTSSRVPALTPPTRKRTLPDSLNLTYPLLSLHISYFCTCHLKFWLL